MTFVAPESAELSAARIPSIIVLGADALLAALPATPVQVAHACALAGYRSVVPASWGDELIAAASLRALTQHGSLPAIQCSCPHVAHRLLAVGTDLRPFLLSLVAPPVVLARYLRAAFAPGKLRITYVGRCPGAGDESIDARLTPEELLAIFADRHIVLEEQPRVFDSVIPPDRRRYRSQPGGLPTPEMLWSATHESQSGARSLVELYGDDLPVELAQYLLAGKPVVIDCAAKLGCVCSGAIPGTDPAEARARIVALEPPRAASPVIDEQSLIDTALPLAASPRSATDVIAPAPTSGTKRVDDVPSPDDPVRARRYEETGIQSALTIGEHPRVAASPPVTRRPSPSRGIARPAAGVLPTARDPGGRQLPRTYVAHRRSPSRTPRSAPIIGQVNTSDRPVNPGGSAPNGGAVASEGVEKPSPAEHKAQSLAAGGSAAADGPAIPASDRGTPDAAAAMRPLPTLPNESEKSTPPRYTERAVALPVTPRSDAVLREPTAPHVSGERPLMQLLTYGLFIAMIVLVSAAIGLIVGRWMSQR